VNEFDLFSPGTVDRRKKDFLGKAPVSAPEKSRGGKGAGELPEKNVRVQKRKKEKFSALRLEGEAG